MGWRSNKKGLGIIAAFLFLMGVVVPAAFGLLTEKAMELGVGDLLDKSTNWDSTNIANSTYFVNEIIEFFDNQTGTIYSTDSVYDSSNELDVALLDTTGTVLESSTYWTDTYRAWILLNKTAFDNVDKVVILFRILDTGGQSLNNLKVNVKLLDYKWGEDYSFTTDLYNATDAYNNTLRVEIPIDAIKRLKIQSSADNPAVYVELRSFSELQDLNGMIVGYRVELYDVKKVNATSAANIMLVVSGILGWVGALAATPYWNPYSNPRHRDVRGAYRKARSKVRWRR